MAVEQLPVLNVRRVDTGFVILAGEKGEYLFEVDGNGESRECVPWDDEMEREFQLYGADIPPTYDMPAPEPEPVASQPVEVPRAQVGEPSGIVTQTDPKLYSSGPRTEEYVTPVSSEELSEVDEHENPYQRAARNAGDWIRRDAERTREREAAAAAVEAHAGAQADQEAKK